MHYPLVPPALLMLLVVLSSPTATVSAADGNSSAEASRMVVRSEAELPAFSYSLEAKPSDLLDDDALFSAFASQVRGNLDALLADYDIQDTATLIAVHAVQRDLALLRGDATEALRRSTTIRELETKPASKLIAGLLEDAAASAFAAGGDAKARKAAFRRHLDETLAPLPWDTVRNDVLELKSAAETLNDNLMLGLVQAHLDPIHAESGAISQQVAAQLIGMRVMRAQLLPHADQQIAALQAYIARHQVQKGDIWAARELALENEQNLAPVVVAIWDSGVDVELFPGRLHVNPGEQANGHDDDGNGFVDDLHGIAHDEHGNRVEPLLLPLDADDRQREAELAAQLKGSQDNQLQIDSPEAADFRKLLGSLKPGDVAALSADLSLYHEYAHGTHVASVAMEGNPAARLLVARDTLPHQLQPPPFTRETARAHARMYRAIVDYLKLHGVRVVNMSWQTSPRSIERTLEANGVGGTPDERRAEARATFEILSNALTGALRSAPEILFIPAAGNSDDDVEFSQFIPAGIDLPNVLTVGGVDAAGDEVRFTSYGRLVRVHANAQQIEGLVPGGGRMHWSGTSLAAPKTTNLAAKLFALEPELTAAEVVKLILDGAEPSDDGRRNLIHPKRSAELLAEMRGRSQPHRPARVGSEGSD